MLVTGENDANANIVASNGMRLEHSQHTSRYTRRKHTWTKLWKEYQEISLGHLWGSVMTPFTSWPILAHLAPPWPFEQVYSSHMHTFHMFHICSHLKFVASISIVFSHTDMLHQYASMRSHRESHLLRHNESAIDATQLATFRQARWSKLCISTCWQILTYPEITHIYLIYSIWFETMTNSAVSIWHLYEAHEFAGCVFLLSLPGFRSRCRITETYLFLFAYVLRVWSEDCRDFFFVVLGALPGRQESISIGRFQSGEGVPGRLKSTHGIWAHYEKMFESCWGQARYLTICEDHVCLPPTLDILMAWRVISLMKCCEAKPRKVESRCEWLYDDPVQAIVQLIKLPMFSLRSWASA